MPVPVKVTGHLAYAVANDAVTQLTLGIGLD